jgi:hypothetical protein
MTTSRRGFFKLLAGAAALAAVPAPAVTSSVPIIWCDGIHDDTPGLSALIRGETVEFADASMADHIGWRGDVLFLAGMFTIKTPVQIGTECSGKILTGGDFTSYTEPAFDARLAKRVTFDRMTMRSGCDEGGTVCIQFWDER